MCKVYLGPEEADNLSNIKVLICTEHVSSNLLTENTTSSRDHILCCYETLNEPSGNPNNKYYTIRPFKVCIRGI